MRYRPLLLTLIACTPALSSCRFERAEAGKPITLDVAVFEGGFGIEWHKRMGREYEKLHPGIKVHVWGDPRVDEKIKPRILRRDPPDLATCTLPTWKLILAGKLMPLDEALDSPAVGQPGLTWRQTLIPGILSDYLYQGHYYSMPTDFNLWVCWFDRRMFRQHGWQPPKTWGEFMALCEKIKAAGIAPLAFQGKYPTYAWATLLALYQRLVPYERWYAMQDIKPGCFLDPEFAHAAKLLQEMAVNYFQQGAMAMTHTESQLEFVNGRAAMVFCGLWLKNEMRKAIPPGFEMDCFAVPVVEGGHGDPHGVYGGGGENFVIFRDAKHPREAAEFLKFLTSLEPARSYIKTLETLSPVKAATRGMAIPPDLRSAVAIQDQATRNFSDRLSGLYQEFDRNATRSNLADLLQNKMTPEEFARRMEAAIDQVRRNEDIYKPAPMGVPPL